MLAQIVLFDGFDPLDVIGPYEVLHASGMATRGTLAVELVFAEGPRQVTSGSGGLALPEQGTPRAACCSCHSRPPGWRAVMVVPIACWSEAWFGRQPPQAATLRGGAASHRDALTPMPSVRSSIPFQTTRGVKVIEVVVPAGIAHGRHDPLSHTPRRRTPTERSCRTRLLGWCP